MAEVTEEEYTVVDDMGEEIGEDETHSITEEDEKLLESGEEHKDGEEEHTEDAEMKDGEVEEEEEEGEEEEGQAQGEDGEEDAEKKDGEKPSIKLALSFSERGYRFKTQYIRDATKNRRMKTIAIYPINLDDLARPTMRSCLEKCASSNWNVSPSWSQCPAAGDAESCAMEGILDMLFLTMEDADEAEKMLPELKEGLKLYRLKADSEEVGDEAHHSHRAEELAARLVEGYAQRELPAKRMLVITNLPESVTERKLMEIFPKAYVGIPVNDSRERLGHAIVEFESREKMLSELDENNGTEIEGGTLNMVDMMMTGVQPLDSKVVYAKVKELVDLRLELAKSWYIHYSRERKAIIKKIYSREAQLELDELVKGENGNETSKWREEMNKRLKQREDDVRTDKTALLTMNVEDLCKEYEKSTSEEPDTVGRGGKRGDRPRGSWSRGGGRDYDDRKGRSWSSSESRPSRGFSRGNYTGRGGYSSRGGYKYERSGPYDRDPRDDRSYSRGRGGFRNDFSMGRGRGSYSSDQALDLLAGLSEILGARESGRDRGYSRGRGRGGFSRGSSRYSSDYDYGEGSYSGSGGYSYRRY